MLNRKIVSFKKLTRKIKPYSATLIGSSFDPFNSYYHHFLEWGAAQSRPLIVIVHPDKIVAIRRGFVFPNEDQFKRARMISKLEFVDWVVISKKLAHDPQCLKLLKPKIVIFQRDNPKYLREVLSILSKKFPKIIFKTAPFRRNFNFFSIDNSSLESFKILKNIKNRILKRLIILSIKSTAPIGKISAILTKNGKIISEKSNSATGEHAEILILKEKNLFKYHSNNYVLYTLIPPCIMCAKKIINSGLKKVYYLYNYGDGLGVEYLKSNKIIVKKCI